MLGTKSRFAGEKIVIADDETAIVELATLLLKRRGFDVVSALDGEACVRMVEDHRPALVLLDYMMPLMNGITVLKQIRKAFPDTYVLMFTGRGSEEIAVEAMKAGATDYIQKPFSNQSLHERIDAVLSRRWIELENQKLITERELLQREIEQWNVELERRVKQKSLELEQAHKEIVQSEKLAALGHLSAGMAHEIRNPLNSINLFAQVLHSAPELNDEYRSYAEKIKYEVSRIENILVQLLASSCDNSSKDQSEINPAEILERVLDEYRPQLQAQNISLVFDRCDSPPRIMANPLEIEQIFSNLIGNALYEMVDGGTLTICLLPEDEKLLFRITDSGAGIPAQYMKQIFDPFFTTKEKGTGFGLSVVLRNIKKLGGAIEVISPPDEGATFLIELPLAAQPTNAGPHRVHPNAPLN